MNNSKINKVVCFGMMADYPRSGVFARIKYEPFKPGNIYTGDAPGGKLSICGVEGPRSNGDAVGGCGQIRRPLFSSFEEGWTAESVDHFWAIWERWHLNNNRAECSHQREAWDLNAEVEVLTYHLTKAARQQRADAQESAVLSVLDEDPNSPVKLTPTARALLLLKSAYSQRHDAPDADNPLSGCYEVTKRETKRVIWVRPEEHPAGLLCKPCEVCEYEYGSSWLYEAVPDDVLDYLRGLPESLKQPAWV